MTALEAFELTSSGGGTDFAQVAALCDRVGSWCVTGGLAVNCYVEPVYTLDADIALPAENLRAVQAELQAAGFKLTRTEQALQATAPESELSIQFTRDDRYRTFAARAVRSEIFGTAVPVACLEDLVQGTVWAWGDRRRRADKRKKDELDLLRLAEAFPEVRPMCPPEVLAALIS